MSDKAFLRAKIGADFCLEIQPLVFFFYAKKSPPSGNFLVATWFRGVHILKNDVHNVANYIENQEEHHKKRNFHDEYVKLLEKHEIEYDERFVFKQVETN